MASSFFGALTQGVRFDKKRFESDVKHFKKTDDAQASKSSKKVDDELDFFGFDALAEKPSAEPKKSKKAERKRTMSMDLVPAWAGNETKSKKKEGSQMRRKRKLSEGAMEEQKLMDEERRQASMLLAPTAKHSKKKKKKQRSRSMSAGSEASQPSAVDSDDDAAESDDNEEVDDDEEEEDDVNLFQKDELTEKIKTKKAKKASTSEAKSSSSNETSDEVAVFRRQMNIRVEGTGVPAPVATFEEIQVPGQHEHIKSILLKNIEASEYKEPTAIQMQAIPSMLLGRDVLATAPTGSGKTAAFAIPILARLGSPLTQEGIRTIVLSPTRELAVQINAEFHRLCAGRKFSIVLLSKATAATMASHVKSKCSVNHDIMIATPLRLVHLIQDSKLDLSTVEMVCLDEADRLFEMGFVEQIDEVLAACTNPKIQRAMFSATMLQGVEEMAQSVLRDPIKISIGVKNSGSKDIEQKLVFVGKEEGKLVAMKQLIQNGLRLPALLFVQNKERANELYHELLYDGVNVGTVHADRTKEQRDETIRQFRSGAVWVLICTDLMSRGMDFKAVSMVINYDFPQSAVSYIHRIGRTGRGGRKGEAVTFFTEDDMIYLRTIANVMKLSGCEVPDWMLSLKKVSINTRKKLLKAPPLRHRINTVSGYDLQNANRVRQMKAKRTRPASEEAKPLQEQRTPAAAPAAAAGPKKSTEGDNKPKQKRNKQKKSD